MFTPPGATPSAADSTAIEGARVRPSFERKSATENHAAHRNFNLYFLVPIMLIVATAMAALVGGTLWLTTLQNRAEAAKERDEVKASFVAGVEAIKATNRTFAVWDEAAERLVNTFDVNWADANEGAYVHDQNGIESTFVVEQSGKVKWGHVDGQRSNVDPAALLGSGYATAMRQIILAHSHGYEPLGGISLSGRGSAIFSITRIRAHGPAFKATSAATR